MRNLPYSEQLHWKSYNEAPKTGISKRALTTDFKGEYATFREPRAETLSILRRWQNSEVKWWTLRDDDLLQRANTPISSSKDEWAEAVMDLSKLVVEGFEIKFLRTNLVRLAEPFSQEDKSITLLEKIIVAKNPVSGPVNLSGLRSVQNIRTKVKGHAGSSDAKSIVQDVFAKHGSYAEHFRQLCALVVDDLQRVESSLSA